MTRTTLLQGGTGLLAAIEPKVVEAVTSSDWMKTANRWIAFFTALLMLWLLIRRTVIHARRDWAQSKVARRHLAELLERERQTFLERCHRDA